jgi:hypothetical protein
VSRVNKAMRETVDVDGLADKIFGKYLKFIDTKARSPGPHINIPPPNPLKPTLQGSGAGKPVVVSGASATTPGPAAIDERHAMRNDLGSMIGSDDYAPVMQGPSDQGQDPAASVNASR